MLVETGVQAAVELVVTDADTAVPWGSGDVPVLATPRLIGLCEEAAFRAVEDHVRPGQTTVGLQVEFTHVAPTQVGSLVRAEATLERVDGQRLVFTVSATDGCGLVGAGKLTRVVVDRERFLGKAR